MDESKFSANPAHPPPTSETRPCHDCGGEGYVPLDTDYRYDTGLLTIIGGLCVACRGEGEVVVYIYHRGGRA